jgi:hypothetical protein
VSGDAHIIFLDSLEALGAALIKRGSAFHEPHLELLGHRVLWARISGNIEKCAGLLWDVETVNASPSKPLIHLSGIHQAYSAALEAFLTLSRSTLKAYDLPDPR